MNSFVFEEKSLTKQLLWGYCSCLISFCNKGPVYSFQINVFEEKVSFSSIKSILEGFFSMEDVQEDNNSHKQSFNERWHFFWPLTSLIIIICHFLHLFWRQPMFAWTFLLNQIQINQVTFWNGNCCAGGSSIFQAVSGSHWVVPVIAASLKSFYGSVMAIVLIISGFVPSINVDFVVKSGCFIAIGWILLANTA